MPFAIDVLLGIVDPLRTNSNILYTVSTNNCCEFRSVRPMLSDGNANTLETPPTEVRLDTDTSVQDDSGRFVIAHFEPGEPIFKGHLQVRDSLKPSHGLGLSEAKCFRLAVSMTGLVSSVAAATMGAAGGH
jgi:hypothetical protein